MRGLLTLILVLSAVSTPLGLGVLAHFFGTPTGEVAEAGLKAVFFQFIVVVAVILWICDIAEHGWDGRR